MRSVRRIDNQTNMKLLRGNYFLLLVLLTLKETTSDRLAENGNGKVEFYRNVNRILNSVEKILEQLDLQYTTTIQISTLTTSSVTSEKPVSQISTLLTTTATVSTTATEEHITNSTIEKSSTHSKPTSTINTTVSELLTTSTPTESDITSTAANITQSTSPTTYNTTISSTVSSTTENSTTTIKDDNTTLSSSSPNLNSTVSELSTIFFTTESVNTSTAANITQSTLPTTYNTTISSTVSSTTDNSTTTIKDDNTTLSSSSQNLNSTVSELSTIFVTAESNITSTSPIRVTSLSDNNFTSSNSSHSRVELNTENLRNIKKIKNILIKKNIPIGSMNELQVLEESELSTDPKIDSVNENAFRSRSLLSVEFTMGSIPSSGVEKSLSQTSELDKFEKSEEFSNNPLISHPKVQSSDVESSVYYDPAYYLLLPQNCLDMKDLKKAIDVTRKYFRKTLDLDHITSFDVSITKRISDLFQEECLQINFSNETLEESVILSIKDVVSLINETVSVMNESDGKSSISAIRKFTLVLSILISCIVIFFVVVVYISNVCLNKK